MISNTCQNTVYFGGEDEEMFLYGTIDFEPIDADTCSIDYSLNFN